MPAQTESKARILEQINACLRSGDYSRAMDLLRGAATEFPNDAELSGLETRAQDGMKRKAEADRLITESQELFAQRKSGEAIQVLRKAYELDKKNSLARAILANALVEHAQSIVETNWLEAETLTNQALSLNPAHPTAKTILNLIVRRKETSSVDDWVAQARKLQSGGDLFAALAWVAEGLAVHPHDAKLLQMQDAIQRDQETRRRQARRGDLDDLRRMQHEIDKAADPAAKQALAARIQGLAAKHWTDGEILSIANALLLRLGLIPRDSSGASSRGKGATVIFHVPRPSAPEAPAAATSQAPADDFPPTQAASIQSPSEKVPPNPVLSSKVVSSEGAAAQLAPEPSMITNVATDVAPSSQILPGKVPAKVVAKAKVVTKLPEPKLPAPPAGAVPAAEPPTATAKVTLKSSRPKQSTGSNATTLIVISAAAVILIAATFFFTRRHYAQPEAQNSAAIPSVSSTPVSTPPVAAPEVSSPSVSAPAGPAPQQAIAEPAPALPTSSDAVTGNVTPQDQRTKDQPAKDQPTKNQHTKDEPAIDQPPAVAGHDVGTLVVMAGQDGARVFLNGKLQRQLTQGGQLRLPDLAAREYVVQVSKNGFQDPPQQKIRIRQSEEARLTFNLQPQLRSQPPPSMASLAIQGGAPGTMVLVDQTSVGTIQADGTLSVSTVNPGDHTVELRKDRFKPRQFKKHFVAGATISFTAADAALEAAPGELKISFTPADASLAIVKGDLLKIVSSGVPLNLPAGTYTLTARTAERLTRWATIEVVAGQSKTLDLNLAPDGMSKWDNPAVWAREGDSFTRRGGDFVLYGAPAPGTFTFSAMPGKGRLLQWVLNYADPQNYVLLQLDDTNFHRTVIRHGQKSDEIIVPHKADKKGLRTLQIRVSPTEIVHQIKQGDSWTTLDHWTQPGTNLSQGKFGFYLPGNEQVTLSSFAHYGELSTH